MAAGVLHAARQRNLAVPQDLSVIGFDDTVIAGHVSPPLTTVRWPIASMARSAALKLLAGTLADDEGTKEPSLAFLSKLIRRGWSGAPATAAARRHFTERKFDVRPEPITPRTRT